VYTFRQAFRVIKSKKNIKWDRHLAVIGNEKATRSFVGIFAGKG
jgi:hypothetical protein